MQRRAGSQYWRLAQRLAVGFTLGVIAFTWGCSAENPSGAGGAGGNSGAVLGEGGDGVAVPVDSIHDPRWDPPTGFEQVQAPPSNATACTMNSQCPTGYCVDGLCCDTKCDNKCMACSAAKKGSGADGICGSVAYDTDPDGECPQGRCDGKNQCKFYNGYPCASTAQCLSNYCVDGFCCGNICMGACQACSAAKKGGGSDGVCGEIAAGTNPDGECASGGTCNGSGACSTSITKLANGTACTSAAQCSSGFCADGVCCDSWCLGSCQACTAAKKGSGSDGTCGNIANDQDPDDECWGGACDGKGVCKQYNGVPCSTKTQCLSGYCVDGFCCGNICTGGCQACSEAKKGQGYDGVCGAISSGRDPEDECNPGECNGSGACNQAQTLQTNGTTCASAAQCASGNCVDGVCCDSACTEGCKACSAAKKGSGADGACGNIAAETDPENECNGGRCDGTGACRFYNGAPCTATSQCFSNYCVDGFCCGNACTNQCFSCSAAKKGSGFDGVCGPVAANADPDNDCMPGECNGSGSCNTPQLQQANGAVCTYGTQCLSGFCVDGVCCDNACTGTCKACSVAKRGQGLDGVCGNIKSEIDPDNECGGGRCHDSGECRYYNGAPCSEASQCFSNYCVDGFCCGNICTGTCFACSAAKKGSGYDGVCGPVGNATDPDNECNPGECNGSGACGAAQSNGAACTLDTQCSSGFCVDGVCCASACNGTCQACSAAKKGSGVDGVCGQIPAETDPDNECNGGRCDGTGVCRFYNGAPCTSTGQCFSNYCVDGFCCGGACTGSCMACSGAKKGSGNNGGCGMIAANTDPDNECALSCNGSGACQTLPDGSACTLAAECAGGNCVSGACCGVSPCPNPCNSGSHLCDNQCVPDSSITQCGTACVTCPVPADSSSVTCNNGTCDFTCNTGFQKVGTTCSALPPRPIAPLSGMIVTSKNPTLRWALPAGVTGAHVKVCADRSCTNVRWSGNVTGNSVSTGTLPTGVSYWQLFGLGSGGPGTIASTTREMVVQGALNASSSGAWGPITDYDGDGFTDADITPGGDKLAVYMGSNSGLASLPARTFLAGNIFSSTVAGDVNADGFVDLLSAVDGVQIQVYYGSLSGLPPSGNNSPAVVSLFDFEALGTGDLNGDGYADFVGGNRQTQVRIAYGVSNGLASPSTTLTSPDSSNSFTKYRNAAVADLNLDGYADLVVSSPDAASNAGVAYLYLGSASGLPTSPSATIANPTGEQNNFGTAVTVAGDVNGDGRPDVYIGVRGEGGCAVCNKGYVYYGAAGGLGTNTVILSPGAAGDAFGYSASAAGDVNGDGYSDLLIANSNPTARFYVFPGSANGIATSPATTISAGWLSRGLLGDTNGDGFSDVLATDNNQMLVLRGSATGLSTTPAQTIFF